MKKNIILFLFTLISYVSIASAATIIEDQNTVKILTPSLADRKTLKLRLDNGLEALLISDPKTDKSGALLSVSVGSWDDPQEHPGMAHFLEHLLFLGTKKYPEEGGYHRYIRDHGGQTNAFTADAMTSYMFSVDNANFDGALDRFAEFFKEPLFNPSGVCRELKAIDQEFQKNLEHDGWRELFVQKNLALPTHPYHRFNAGNSETLKNTSCEDVKKWYSEHYSANLMRLMVVSDQPLETLQELVIQKFSAVVDRQKAPSTSKGSYIDSNILSKMVVIQPVKDLRQLTIHWALPEQIAPMKLERQDAVVCFLLGHEGDESLLEQLKREGLASTLSCGGMDVSLHHREMALQIGLTDKGFHKVNTVLERVFQAINQLRTKTLPPHLFEEMQKLQYLDYQYQARQDLFQTLMRHGMTIHSENIATYPLHTNIVQQYDPKIVAALLNHMTPYNAVFYLMAPSGTIDMAESREEPWFKVPYSIREIDGRLLDQWHRALPHDAIGLPPSNPFIPAQLETVSAENFPSEAKLIPEPECLSNDAKGIFYYATDSRFREPKISWLIEIKTPHIHLGDASSIVLADLYIKSLQEELKKYSYPAEVAGLKYRITSMDNGIAIHLSGFNDKALQLLETIVKAMKEGISDKENFKRHKETLAREYANCCKDSPLEQDFELYNKTVYKFYTTAKEKSNALKRVSPKLFEEFSKKLFTENYIQALLYGNMSRSSALQVESFLKKEFDGKAYEKGAQLQQQVIDLSDQSGPFYLLAETPMQGNALILGIEYLPYSLKARAAQEIVMKGMSEPFFSELRTRQQTGYIVMSDGQDLERHLFNVFAVQSSTHDTRELLARFELFIEGFLQELEKKTLDEERFAQLKQALVKKLENPAKNITEMGTLLQTLAFDFNGDFLRVEKRLKAVKELSYKEFVELSRQMLGRSNKRRVAFMIKGEQSSRDILNYNKAKSANEIKKLGAFSAASLLKTP